MSLSQTMHDILFEAAEPMRSRHRIQVDEKAGHANFVTSDDRAVQESLYTLLAKAFPGARMLGEEEDTHVRIGEGLTFVIDPIDGTMNYIRRREASMISVGAVQDGILSFGAIYDPYKNSFYFAKKGKGAFCNGEAIHVSDYPPEKALVGFGTSPYNTPLHALSCRTAEALLSQIADLRRLGTAAMELCDVACGRADGYFEWILQPWDFCAGTLLVQEAGGRCGTIGDGPLPFDLPSSFLAANEKCYDFLLETLLRVKG